MDTKANHETNTVSYPHWMSQSSDETPAIKESFALTPAISL